MGRACSTNGEIGIIIIIIYLNCKWGFTWWQWYYNKTQHTNNTHHTKLHTVMKQNTAHETTQTIKDTLHTMNTMQIQLQLQYRILVGKPEGKKALGRPRRRWVDNIKMYLRDIVWDGMNWIHLAQDRDQWRALVNMVMNLLVS
jgi:hypothetical protein